MSSEKMSDSQLEQEILAVERRRVQAMVEKDIATLHEILGEDLSYTHSGGRIDDKHSFLELIGDPANQYEGVDYSGTEVIPGGNGAVIVRGKAQIRLLRPGGEHIGYPVWFLDVFVKRDSRWQLVAWQATRVPE